MTKNNACNDEIFPIVDENGDVIANLPRKLCHNGSKPLHPVVHLHIINSKNELLLQKRRHDKDIQPGKWDTSVGGHIQYEENVIEALIRESKEEAGIDIDSEKVIFIKKYIHESDVEKELVYTYIYRSDGRIVFQESEIEKVDFFDKIGIERLILEEKTTPNFIKEFNILKENNYI